MSSTGRPTSSTVADIDVHPSVFTIQIICVQQPDTLSVIIHNISAHLCIITHLCITTFSDD